MKYIPIVLLGLLLVGVAGPVAAQDPATAAVIESAMQQPGAADLIRAKIASSGLTPDQIRQRLTASGYDPSLLDGYFGGAAGPAQAPTANHLAAINALGLAPAAPAPANGGGVVPAAVDSAGSGIYGMDVFRRGGSVLQPATTGPVPADYRLGPGDQLVLLLTGDVELALPLSITGEGFVVIPQVGQVFLANLSMVDARKLLAARLGRAYSGLRRDGTGTTQFDLSVANVRVVQVFVVGEVRQPGAYQMSALGTVLNVLYSAGGPTDDADMRHVVVRRRGTEVTAFDLYDYVSRGEIRSDLRLENGDVVFVGVRNRRVRLDGSVHHPALFDLLPNETLADLVTLAGGLKAEATLSRISIQRILPMGERTPGTPQRVTIDVRPEPQTAGGTTVIPPVALEDADVVTIYGITDAERNYVEIGGSVYLPGKFGFAPGLTLSRLVTQAGGLKPATYAGRAHISRLNPEDQTQRLIAVELPADSTSPWPQDLALEDRDVVTIYNRLAMRPEMNVTISGAVNEPKTVPWREGMTVRDLILASNGLTPGAWLDSAEVARLPSDRSQGAIARTFRVPLDSTYIFDRDSLGRPLLPPGAPFRAGGAPETVLHPWDQVLILRQPDFTFHRTVTILGEVRFPGTYAMRSRDERVADLIQRAGGLTERAYTDGVRFERTLDDVGRIDIKLPEALASATSRHNLILQPGDRIEIPEFVPSVHVAGAVNSPGSVLWQKGRPLREYVNAAGGFTSTAEKGQARVQQANGTIDTRRGGFLFFGGHDPVPGPGSTVTVPLQPPAEYHDRTGFYVAIASMIASSATIVIALTR